MSDLNEEVQSPCISVCVVDDETGFCQGCFRTTEEIQDWWDMDNAQKESVVVQAKARESAVFED